MLTPTRAFLDGMLSRGAGSSSTTLLGNASVGLLKGPFTPSVDTTYAEIEVIEADYDGYARQAAGLDTTPHIGFNNLSYIQGDLLLFSPSDTITPNTIYGLFLTGTASTTLLGVEIFDNPLPLPGPAEQITIIPRVGLDPDANYGLAVVTT